MNRKEQEKFVRELLHGATLNLLRELPKIPEEWDGWELRQWIADRFQNHVIPMDKKRMKEYRNECLVRGI